MKKEILNIDMDGVCADFDKAILKLDPSIGTLSSTAPNYEERSARVDALVEANTDIFENLEPIEGSIEAIKRLSQHFEIYFVSTPMDAVPESFTGKKRWLNKNFGELSKKRLVLTHRKDLVAGDYLVDDRLVNGVENFKGKHIHFGTEKFPNWTIVEMYLMARAVANMMEE
jgi:5'-nucleotidase